MLATSAECRRGLNLTGKQRRASVCWYGQAERVAGVTPFARSSVELAESVTLSVRGVINSGLSHRAHR